MILYFLHFIKKEEMKLNYNPNQWNKIQRNMMI